MSVLWSDNAGADVKTVFSQSNVHVVATGTASVNPFEVSFQLDQPFIYDPKNGSLAMYFRLDGTKSFDGAKLVDAQGFGSLATTPFAYLDTSTPIVSSRGLVTEFGWVAIPEPTVGNLICFAALLPTFALLRNSGICFSDSHRRQS
jgi:hypothetical protein